MATSDRAYNQVKSILSKLDRSISDARDKRTRPGTPAVHSPVEPATRSSVPAPEVAPSNRPTNSPYGRATPLPPRNEQPPLRWGT